MQNMKLQTKLIGSFILVSLITGIVGYVGINRIQTIAQVDRAMFEDNVLPYSYMADYVNSYQEGRSNIRNAIIGKWIGDVDVAPLIARIKDSDKKDEALLHKFKQAVNSQTIRQ